MDGDSGRRKIFLFGDFRLDAESKTIRDGEQREIHLAKRPFEVLLYLIENRGRVVGRDELLEKFWDGHDVYADALRKCVGAIRKSLRDTAKPPRLIETRYGGGYRFVGAVSEETSEKRENEEKEPDGFENRRLKSEISENLKPNAKARNFRYVFTAAAALFFVSLGFFVYYSSVGEDSSRQNLASAAAAAASSSSAPVRSIAVLPLKNLTGDAKNDYLSDGITESLINELSQLKELKVTSRGSAFSFKNQELDAREIGQKLGVEAILEGGVRRSGDRLRVEVRLVGTGDGAVLWASDFEEKPLADIFKIQDGIVCRLVSELKVKICGELATAERYTKNVRAYQLYLQGLYHRNRLGGEDLKRAVEFYEEALRAEPDYALAHEGLATAYMLMEFNSQVAPGSVAAKALFHAERALRSDENLAGAYIVLGAIKTLRNYDLTEREKYYQQALLKYPNHRTARLWLSNVYTARGEFEKAEAEILRVQEIDPLSFGVRLTLAELYYYWRKPDKVIEQADLMLLAKPGDQTAYDLLAKAQAQKGDFEAAVRLKERIPPNAVLRTAFLMKSGREAEARKFVETLSGSSDAKSSPYLIANHYAALGDKEKSFAWLERAYEMRQADLISLKIEPNFDFLRDDARFRELLRRVNLTD